MNVRMKKNSLDQALAPKKRRSHAESIELSDRLMLEATVALVLSVGTQKTTLKEVGEKAGYSRGLANARFGSKDNLFLALANKLRKLWLEELQNLQGHKTGLEALYSRLDAIEAFVRKYPEEAWVMYILWFESVGAPSDLNKSLARFHEQAREDICTIVSFAQTAKEISPDINPSTFATQFCGTFFGLCYQWVVKPDAIDIATNIREYKNLLTALLSGKNA